MTPTKPCIIRWRTGYGHYTAYTDHGRQILSRRTYVECANAVESLNYAVIPPSTLWHQSILDRIQERKGLVLA